MSTLVDAACHEADYQLTDWLIEGQIRINCGSVNGYMKEKYLHDQLRSTAIRDKLDIPGNVFNDFGGGHFTTKRWTDGMGYFVYRIPLKASKGDPLYLSMSSKGDMRLYINDGLILDTVGKAGDQIIARELRIDELLQTNTDYIDVKVEGVPVSGYCGVSIYWMEIGKTSPWRERAKHIVWDTSDILWQIGYYDGYGNEFSGDLTELEAGQDFSQLSRTGTVHISWDQEIDRNKKYYLLTGIIGGKGKNYIDVGDNGSNEVESDAALEKIYDIDVTALVATKGNKVKIQMADGAVLDFVTLVEATDGCITDEHLRVVFKGNEMALNWTRLVNMTMYWNNEYMVDKSTGFIDASLANGIFSNGYWVADAAPAILEMAKWGYHDLAKQAIDYKNEAEEYCDLDNGASGLIFSSMAYLIKSENYSGKYVEHIWPKLKDGLDYFCRQIHNNEFHIIRGNNWETTSCGYGIYNNSIAYFALLSGAEVAEKLGLLADSRRWMNVADSLYKGINTHLMLDNDINWLGTSIPSGTFRYAIDAQGKDVCECHAGWFGVGSQEELCYGYRGHKSVALWRDVVNKMLDHHSENFWPDWKAYGHNQGFGTDYGVLSERGGWPLNSLLMSDRMDMAKKNLHHIIWNSTDYNFENGNEGVQETSPWILVREVDRDDDGVDGAMVGNGGFVEDMNLVEYIVTLKNVRLMAGLDDSLYGIDNIVIIPRIPRGWKGVKVNRWPVNYRNGEDISNTTVSYDYNCSPIEASIDIRAENEIRNVKIRFGPFDIKSKVVSITENGLTVDKFEIEDRGDARWVWITTDINRISKKVSIQMLLTGLMVYDSFDGRNPSDRITFGGKEVLSNGYLEMISEKNAWSLYCTPNEDITISADLKIIEGHAAGITFRNKGNGVSGYHLMLNAEEGMLKLCKGADGKVLAVKNVNVKRKRTYTLKAQVEGSHIDCYLDGVKVFEVNDRTYVSGLAGLHSDRAEVLFEDLLCY